MRMGSVVLMTTAQRSPIQIRPMRIRMGSVIPATTVPRWTTGARGIQMEMGWEMLVIVTSAFQMATRRSAMASTMTAMV